MDKFPPTPPREISALVRSRLSPGALGLLERAGELAAAEGWKAYAVGGMVRDVLLGRGSVDLDILVEEHGLEFARLWARIDRGGCKLYRRFATAMVIIGGSKIDITTTRSEKYPVPGALPEVVPGSLEDDLRRRDFTINALAFSIRPGDFGRLVDVCGGWEDLRNGVIRVLHERSFRDDPTRIFRAVRFRQRFGFSVDPGTERLIRTAVDERVFSTVAPERLRRELELILAEPSPSRAIELMADYDELRFIYPGLSLSREIRRGLSRLEEGAAWFRKEFPDEEICAWRVFFGALTWELPPGDFQAAGMKFNLAGKFLRSLAAAREIFPAAALAAADDGSSPSRLVGMLDRLLVEAVLILQALLPEATQRDRLKRYLGQDRFVRGFLTGQDLIGLGAPPGPELGNLQARLRAARLDREVRTRDEEVALARKLIDRGLVA